MLNQNQQTKESHTMSMQRKVSQVHDLLLSVLDDHLEYYNQQICISYPEAKAFTDTSRMEIMFDMRKHFEVFAFLYPSLNALDVAPKEEVTE